MTAANPSQPRVGWIGLGKLGLPMALRLAGSGYGVSGYDRDESRVALASDGGIATTANAAAACDADIVITSLPDDAALRAALCGSGGLIATMRAGATLVETSTVSALASAEAAEEAQSRSVAYLRVPISGNASIAHTGALTCFASGPRAAFDGVVPVLSTFTRKQTWLGEGEEARYAKLAVNLMIAVSMAMMSETLALARKGGIGWRDMLDLLAESAVGSPMVKYKAATLIERDFASSFSCRQMAKDLDLILGAAHAHNVPTPLAALVREMYGSLIAQGEGEEDFSATVKLVERLSGLGEPAR
jgi:3-hydroxyisobutyrate dehydrogenase-like beta-hydroxyacid dehydrogenase